MPTHDRKDMLLAAVASVEAQTRRPDALVVVADGCSDGSAGALRGGPADIVLETEGVGAAAARNAGWRAVDTDIVAFLDDDCEADPGWLEGLVAGFDDDDVGLVQGRTEAAGPVGPYDRTIRIDSETGLYESCNIAYRRAALEHVGGFNEDFGRQIGGRPFGEDTDLAWRVRRAGWSTRFADKAVVRHRVFPGTPGQALAEAWRNRGFPFVVREVPELAASLPGGRFALRRHSAAAQIAAVGVVACAATRRAAPLALTLPYGVWLSRRTRRPGRAAFLAVKDMVTSAALISGSVRHRRLVL